MHCTVSHHTVIINYSKTLWGPSVVFSKLTRYAQVDERACLVLSIPLVHSLHIVRPSVTGFCGKDHQLILQCDGSVSETRYSQCQGHLGECNKELTHQANYIVIKTQTCAEEITKPLKYLS